MFSRFAISICVTLLFFTPPLYAHAPSHSSPAAQDVCPRPAEGVALPEPHDLRSVNGVLKVDFFFRNQLDPDGHMRYCYVTREGYISPNLRLHPGDTLVLSLKNEVSLPLSANGSASAPATPHESSHPSNADGPDPHNPCLGGMMVAGMTNLHFHGMVIPPTCHEDDVLKTSIRPSDPAFVYRVPIPKDAVPGLYWYHPHPHGLTEEQVLGGASGALIIEGLERFNKHAANLPERVILIRDQEMPGAITPVRQDLKRPTKDVSINFVPVPYPKYSTARIEMKPGRNEFWRVVNASADTYTDLELTFAGKLQYLGVLALDGVPIGYDQGGSSERILWMTHIPIPPAGRAEFVVKTPVAPTQGLFSTRSVTRGPLNDDDIPKDANGMPIIAPGMPDQDDNDPARPLASISVQAAAPSLPSRMPASPGTPLSSDVASLANATPVRTRTFYFSEDVVDPNDPKNGTLFLITEEGHTPKPYDPHSTTPDVVVHQGDVEDWIIENRSNEPHTFHIHQTHFLVIGTHGVPHLDPNLRDTVNVPFWDGFSRQYPSVKLRMDFRSPKIIGIFPYHCHILQHEDGGMMGTIEVLPPEKKSK